ncbi:MAG: hypothetical protein KDA94_16780 [Acidimicrobiales bacterium]|nr:hypothetical protein [Acidimicrobiales bacterium]
MRVTLDSNAWETIFDPDNLDCEPLRVAMASGVLEGYICESAFRIEAINKGGRTEYFQHPKMDVGMSASSFANDRVPGGGVAWAFAVLSGRGREWISSPQQAG